VSAEGQRPLACTRPSTLAKVLDDGYGLQAYVAATSLATVARHKDLRDRMGILAAEHPEADEWRSFKPLHEAAQERRGKPEAEAGTNIHKVMEGLVAGSDMEGLVAPDVLCDARAALDALHALDMEPATSEEFVVNLDALPEPYAGTRDLLALHRPSGWLVTVDLKTTHSLGNEVYRALSWSMQLAMYANGQPYAGQVERDRWDRPVIDPSQVLDEDRAVHTGAGIVLEVERGTGQTAVHRVDLVAGLEFARLACQVRAARKAPVLL
jgi:hypothetical protein